MTQEYSTQLEQGHLTDSWKQWEGQIINDHFPLHRYLGGASHSAVFLTDFGDGETPQRAAIKLVPDNSGAELQLSRWQMAAGLSHSSLIGIFESGRCQVDDVRLLYLVMEYAEEDVSQILPQRPLTPSEARDLLKPAIEALAYLHGIGLAHGHIKPANIMACGDRVKLSSDRICRGGEPVGELDTYTAPEKKCSPAADVWALGMSLAEVLTQRLPLWEREEQEEPIVPDTLAEPFRGIVRRCLRRNPALRIRVPDIASRLDPLPVQELPQSTSVQGTSPKVASYFVWTAAMGALLAITLASSFLLKRHPHPRRTRPDAIEKPAEVKVPPRVPEASNPQAETDIKSATPASVRPAEEEKTPTDGTVGAVGDDAIHQVLPEVPQKARDTIRGTVRVGVKVSVDPSGRVAEATLDYPGPSKYFANLALQSARGWTFGPTNAASQNGFRRWILHFEFSGTDTRAVPVEVVP